MIPFKWAALVLFLSICGLSAYRFYHRHLSGNAVLYFFDVGQGDSALLKLPFGKTFLIDTGGGMGEFSLGNDLIGELTRLGILRINGMILSHFDQDHAQQAPNLLRNIEIDNLWVSGPLSHEKEKTSWLFNQIKAETSNQGTTLIYVDNLKTIGNERYQVSFFPTRSRHMKSNDGLAVLVEIYGCRFLWMGDLDKEAEKKMPDLFKARTEVLKVGHHGSRHSSDPNWLSQIQPRFSVISVGADNSYGHPHPTVLHHLRGIGSTILRTDFHGFIAFTVTPEGRITCQSAAGPDCGSYSCR